MYGRPQHNGLRYKMIIYLKNFQTDILLQVLNNVINRSGVRDGQVVGVNGLTAYKLNKIRKDLTKEAKDWQEMKKILLDDHVEGGSENPKTEGNSYIFKSEKDEENYIKVAEDYSEITVRALLTEKDLSQLSIAGQEIDFIQLIVEGEAKTECDT